VVWTPDSERRRIEANDVMYEIDGRREPVIPAERWARYHIPGFISTVLG
jgi:hypothetical protein